MINEVRPKMWSSTINLQFGLITVFRIIGLGTSPARYLITMSYFEVSWVWWCGLWAMKTSSETRRSRVNPCVTRSGNLPYISSGITNNAPRHTARICTSCWIVKFDCKYVVRRQRSRNSRKADFRWTMKSTSIIVTLWICEQMPCDGWGRDILNQ